MVDVARDAVVPRSMRPSRSTSPIAVVALAVLLLFLTIVIMVVMSHHCYEPKRELTA